jgi:hypothetical protein
MEPRASPGQATGVPRLLIACSRPQHLSASEADAWFRTELTPLRRLPGVESVVVTRVMAAARHPRPCDWLCEVHLEARADWRACAEHPWCTEWLMDLRLLGMRPTLAVLDGGEEVV